MLDPDLDGDLTITGVYSRLTWYKVLSVSFRKSTIPLPHPDDRLETISRAVPRVRAEREERNARPRDRQARIIGFRLPHDRIGIHGTLYHSDGYCLSLNRNSVSAGERRIPTPRSVVRGVPFVASISGETH